MSEYKQTRAILKDFNLAPQKRFGQNFLVNKQTAEAIVRAGNITDQDFVLEVGVGLGALTRPLAEAARHVLGFEIDNGIVRLLEKQGNLPANVTLIHQDILTADFQELYDRCDSDLIIIANLPYSISNPFIFKLIDNAHLLNRATIMVQKEVADRLMSGSGTKEYGIPTVLLGSCATVEKLMTLKPAEFHPQPKIDSVVIGIDFSKTSRRTGDFADYDKQIFRRLVRVAFSQRRKTLLNTLSSGGFFVNDLSHDKAGNKKQTRHAIESAAIDPSTRAECLDVSDFICLANIFKSLMDPSL
ncbi:MAG: ribosomal RNA small subunit methyltransferase A [Deltaproteobacteria bacterium]|nr:ribosomal RNA small subunit methyltransferase A [Deltaproteobacteria bacterium]